jgi:hypothetical protein
MGHIPRLLRRKDVFKIPRCLRRGSSLPGLCQDRISSGFGTGYPFRSTGDYSGEIVQPFRGIVYNGAANGHLFTAWSSASPYVLAILCAKLPDPPSLPCVADSFFFGVRYRLTIQSARFGFRMTVHPVQNLAAEFRVMWY